MIRDLEKKRKIINHLPFSCFSFLVKIVKFGFSQTNVSQYLKLFQKLYFQLNYLLHLLSNGRILCHGQLLSVYYSDIFHILNDLMTCLLIVYIYLIKLNTQISEGGNDTQNGEKGKWPYFHFFNTVISSVTKQKRCPLSLQKTSFCISLCFTYSSSPSNCRR